MEPPPLLPAQALTPQFVESEYNNRARVADHGDYFARWERDSQFVRATLLGHLDLAYGPEARHRIDLFPAARARGLLVFIHGGYWRSLDKAMFSWLAASWVAGGIGVAIPNYRLCPAVRIEQIIDDVVAALNWLFAHGARYGLATERVVLSGHSAGGHLTGALFAQPRARLTFDPARIVGGVPMSGLVDFEPLLHSSFNADFCLDPEAVSRLNLYDKRPTLAAPLVIAVGGDESSEFKRQSRLLAHAWSAQAKALLVLDGRNHFSIVDAFAERGQPLYDSALALLG